MIVGFVVTARCNAACTHCSTSCGPTRTEALSPQAIMRVMDEAAALRAQEEGRDEPLRFCITGGEPFLDFAGLLTIVAHGTALGGIVTCVTNGYWASSDGKARRLLGQLRDAGLRSLAVSTSRFHREFVNATRVRRALRTARELGLRTVLKCAATVADRRSGWIDEFTGTVAADRVEVFAVMPWLRQGAALPGAEYTRDRKLPEGRCPAPVLTVREDGRVFMCCTPGADVDFLSLGSVHEATLEQINDRFCLRGRQQILREEGPAYFGRRIAAAGHGARLRGAYADVCDLCTHIASDPTLAAVAAAAAREREQEQLTALFGPLIRRAPA